MKLYRVCIITCIFFILLQCVACAEEIHFWDLERTSDLKITVFDEKNAIYEEKMEIRNNRNESVDIHAWFPLTWPYFVDNTEYSEYPYEEWKIVDEKVIVNVSASDIELQLEQMGVEVDPSYLKSIESYPLIPGILFEGELEIGKKTGLAMRTKNPTGLITEKNGSFSLYFAGITEGKMNSITIKIPRQVRKYWFFHAVLEIENVIPSFAIEPYDPEYKIYRWEEDFLMQYFEDLERNLTKNEIKISYSYVIPIDEIATTSVIFVVTSIFSIFLGIGIQRYIDKKTQNKNRGDKKKK